MAKNKRTGIAFHHTTGSSLGRDDCAEWVRAIQDFHMNTNGWDDIGYNSLVCRHGDRFEGRGWSTLGAHVAGHNTAYIGVCALGDLRRVDNLTDALLAGLAAERDSATAYAGHRLKVVGHGDLAATQCPGTQLAAWIAAGMPLAPDDAQPPRDTPKRDQLVLPGKTMLSRRAVRPSPGSTLDRETRRVQAELAYVHGISVGAVDGWFGPRTDAGVRTLQTKRRAQLVDGIVGPETWGLMLT